MVVPKARSDLRNMCAIYFVGLATLAESILFIMLFNMVLNQVYTERNRYEQWSIPLPEHYNRAASIATLALTMYAIRLSFGVFLIVGHILKSLKILLIFLVYMGVGIAINIAIGVMGSGNQLTRGYARICFWVIGLHLIYISISWRVLKVEFEKRVIAEGPQGPTGHVPYGSPAQATVNAGPNPHSQVSFTCNRAEPIQLYPAGHDNPNIQNETAGYPYPLPPKYSEVDENAGNSTRQNSDKPVN